MSDQVIVTQRYDGAKTLLFDSSAERQASQYAFDQAIHERNGGRQELALEKHQHTTTKEALATRDDFLAIVSHDLRSPLGVISLSADELATMGGRADDLDLRHELVAMIQRNAATMERLISDLLDVERMSGNKLLLTMAHHDLNGIVVEVIQTYKLIAVAKNLSLTANLLSTPLVVACDRDRIQQVLSNFLSNAVKFTPHGGSIVVETTQLGQTAYVAVVDSGQGIIEAETERIFERSTQVDARDRRGLGLGLYISKWLIEAHRGKIGVESSPGLGSKFFFTLRC